MHDLISIILLYNLIHYLAMLPYIHLVYYPCLSYQNTLYILLVLYLSLHPCLLHQILVLLLNNISLNHMYNYHLLILFSICSFQMLYNHIQIFLAFLILMLNYLLHLVHLLFQIALQ